MNDSPKPSLPIAMRPWKKNWWPVAASLPRIPASMSTPRPFFARYSKPSKWLNPSSTIALKGLLLVWIKTALLTLCQYIQNTSTSFLPPPQKHHLPPKRFPSVLTPPSTQYADVNNPSMTIYTSLDREKIANLSVPGSQIPRRSTSAFLPSSLRTDNGLTRPSTSHRDGSPPICEMATRV